MYCLLLGRHSFSSWRIPAQATLSRWLQCYPRCGCLESRQIEASKLWSYVFINEMHYRTPILCRCTAWPHVSCSSEKLCCFHCDTLLAFFYIAPLWQPDKNMCGKAILYLLYTVFELCYCLYNFLVYLNYIPMELFFWSTICQVVFGLLDTLAVNILALELSYMAFWCLSADIVWYYYWIR